MPGTSYITENIVVRAEILNNAPFTEGVYKRGQLVGRVKSTGNYAPYDTSANTGVETIRAVVVNDMDIPAGGGRGAVARGEFMLNGVAKVMAGLSPAVNLNDGLIGQCFDAGILLN